MESKNKTKKNQTHRYREQTIGYQWGEGEGKGRCYGYSPNPQATEAKHNSEHLLGQEKESNFILHVVLHPNFNYGNSM